MTATALLDTDAIRRAVRSAHLDQARAAAKAAGWTAEVVTLTADERAELISDYGLDGV